jgi:hypothetical protein
MVAVLVSLALKHIDYLAAFLVKGKRAPLLCFGRPSPWDIVL